jgi:thiosulfate/3-mercaptopyruvate sulfurtransferase
MSRNRLRFATFALMLLVGLTGPMPRILAQPATPAATPSDEYAHPEWLVDPAWLSEHRADPTVKVVALTPAEEFAAGHVPGAAQVDWPELGVTDTSDPSIARWQGEVEGILTALGIARADTVVVYDGGTLWAARLWWILDQLGHADKRILNGGLPAWTAAGGELESGASTVQPATQPYRGTPHEAALAPLDLVVASLDDPAVVLVDARSAKEYAEGHIPGAVSVDFPLNAAPETPKTWKPVAELRAMYAALGVTPDKLVIPYCTTGVRSAVTYFTLRLIGYPDVRLFTGSWQEWSNHPELPVATGETA